MKAVLYIRCLLALILIIVKANAQLTDTAYIQVNLSKETGEMTPVWAWFGYDEPNYTYMKDGKKLLSELAALSPVPVYVRTHNMLTTGDGTPALKWGSTNAYTEDAGGNTVAFTVNDVVVPHAQTNQETKTQVGKFLIQMNAGDVLSLFNKGASTLHLGAIAIGVTDANLLIKKLHTL